MTSFLLLGIGWWISGVTPVDSFPVVVTPTLQESLRTLHIPPFLRDTIWIYHAQWKEETLDVVIDDILGKHEPITFAVGIQHDTVRFVEVLVYRESYGGEIQDPKFLQYFQQKTFASPLSPGQDIPRIAGATISVNAITLGVRRTLWLLQQVHQDSHR